MDRYAVMGNPVAHSKSPTIHSLFARQTNQALEYHPILVDEGAFGAAVDRFQAEQGKGLNITVPFKQEAWRAVDELSDRARRAEAVNTILFRDNGTRLGDNTDGVGLVRDLCENHGIVLAGARVLLLGAGGAVRGVLGPLLEQQPQQLMIANRTPEKAVALAEAFADLGTVQGSDFASLAGQQFDVIINGTAASLQGQVPAVPPGVLAPGACCYDMMYGDRPTAFMNWASEQGAQVVLDGLGMLVEQAAESFRLWRGIRPETAPVIAHLRQ